MYVWMSFTGVLIIRSSHVYPFSLSSNSTCDASFFFFNHVWRQPVSLPITPVLVRLNSSHGGPGSSIIQPVMLFPEKQPSVYLCIRDSESINDEFLETDLLRGNKPPTCPSSCSYQRLLTLSAQISLCLHQVRFALFEHQSSLFFSFCSKNDSPQMFRSKVHRRF